MSVDLGRGDVSPDEANDTQAVDSQTAEAPAAEIQAAWDRVYTAITLRWPAIDQLELLECEQNVEEIVGYVDRHVDAADDEVRSVVVEFAPSSPSAAAVVSETAGDVIDRIHYEIDEAPVKSSLAGMLIGFSLGVVATTIYSNACRKAEMRRRGWFS